MFANAVLAAWTIFLTKALRNITHIQDVYKQREKINTQPGNTSCNDRKRRGAPNITATAEVELFSADVDGRRGTEGTVVAGSGVTRKGEFVGKVKEQMKQFPLGAVEVPKRRVIFSCVKWEDTTRTLKKSRDPCKPKRRRSEEEQ